MESLGLQGAAVDGKLRDEPRGAREEGRRGQGTAERRPARGPPRAPALPDREPPRDGQEEQPVAARELGANRAADAEAPEHEVDRAQGRRGDREERRAEKEGEGRVGGLAPRGGDRDDRDRVQEGGERGAVEARQAAGQREDDGDGAQIEDRGEDARHQVEPRAALHAERTIDRRQDELDQPRVEVVFGREGAVPRGDDAGLLDEAEGVDVRRPREPVAEVGEAEHRGEEDRCAGRERREPRLRLPSLLAARHLPQSTMRAAYPRNGWGSEVGEAGFEPATTSTQSSCTTGLCDSPRPVARAARCRGAP